MANTFNYARLQLTGPAYKKRKRKASFAELKAKHGKPVHVDLNSDERINKILRDYPTVRR